MGFDPQSSLQQREWAALRKAQAERKKASLDPEWPYVVIRFPLEAFGLGNDTTQPE